MIRIFLLTLVLPAILVCSKTSVANGELPLSSGPHLFIDDYLIDRHSALTRTTHQPQRLPAPVIRSAEDWHEWPSFSIRVIPDPQTGVFRMWYNLRNIRKPDPFTAYGYAESTDGLKWRRPDLGLIDVGGSTKNNLFMAGRMFSQLLVDEGLKYAEPDQRYKLAWFGLEGRDGMCVAFSSDGLRFTPYEKNPVLTSIGDIVDGCWDPLQKRYIAAVKLHSEPEDGYKGGAANTPEGYRRLVGMTTSTDFVEWSEPYRIVAADPKEPGLWEFYGMVPQVRGDLYIGFLRILRDDLPAEKDGAVAGIGWTELTTSRDGQTWTRHREPFLDRGSKPGVWDRAMAWVGDCVTVGDEEYIYYGGYSAGHKIGVREIGVARLRKNGFVSRDAGSVRGALLTRRVVLKAASMTVNANVQGGMQVRVLDASGAPVQGFDWSDCKTIRGDSVAHPVQWKGRLSSLKDRPVSLEFALREAQLYGFNLK